ncbi:MAG: bacteriocin [Planctomycetaceae bacterium]
MFEFQTVSESELQSIEGGAGILVPILVGAALGAAIVGAVTLYGGSTKNDESSLPLWQRGGGRGVSSGNV